MRNKIEKTHAKKKKKSHAQDNIYVIRQFVYIHGVAGILLLSGKKYKVWQYSFSLSQKLLQKTLITKTTIFISYVGLSAQASAP